MADKFVCPSCRGRLNKSEQLTEGVTRIRYICESCKEAYPVRDTTPVLIYPKTDTQQFEVMYSGGTVARRRSLFRRAADLFIYKCKTSGISKALTMIPTYAWVKIYNKSIVKLSHYLRSENVRCSCCGWEGLKFGTFWGSSRSIRNFACPCCGSHPRHRFLSQY